MTSQQNTPDAIARQGEEIYFSKLQKKLEPDQNGNYVVIEVESKKYFVEEDLFSAINKAREKFPDKLFHIIQIGNISKTALKQEPTKFNAWNF